MHPGLRYKKWHSKVKIIFLFKLALIYVMSALESWPQLLSLKQRQESSSGPKQLPMGGWAADCSCTSLRGSSKLKEPMVHPLIPEILKGIGIAPWSLYKGWFFPYVIRRSSGLKSSHPLHHKSKSKYEKKKKSEEQRERLRLGRLPFVLCILKWACKNIHIHT